MILEAKNRKAKSANPLDDTMTPTQVVRRKFKSGLPRTIENRQLSPMEAIGKTFELFDRLLNGMEEAGLKESNASAGLVYYNDCGVFAETIALPEPKPEAIGEFVKKVMSLKKPVFLGVIFLQHDPDTKKTEYRNVVFVWPFIGGPDAERRLIIARNSQASKMWGAS
jgi:hypothetical protein